MSRMFVKSHRSVSVPLRRAVALALMLPGFLLTGARVVEGPHVHPNAAELHSEGTHEHDGHGLCVLRVLVTSAYTAHDPTRVDALELIVAWLPQPSQGRLVADNAPWSTILPRGPPSA